MFYFHNYKDIIIQTCKTFQLINLFFYVLKIHKLYKKKCKIINGY